MPAAAAASVDSRFSVSQEVLSVLRTNKPQFVYNINPVLREVLEETRIFFALRACVCRRGSGFNLCCFVESDFLLRLLCSIGEIFPLSVK